MFAKNLILQKVNLIDNKIKKKKHNHSFLGGGKTVNNVNKLTQNSITEINRAQNKARENGNTMVEQLHLCYALLSGTDSLNYKLIELCGVNAKGLLEEVDSKISRLPKVHGANGELYLDKFLSTALAESEKIANQMKDEYVSVEHLFLGLLTTPSTVMKSLFYPYCIFLTQLHQQLLPTVLVTPVVFRRHAQDH